MLSNKMANVLKSVPFQSTAYMCNYKDGRTVRAIQARGLIKKVTWSQAHKAYTFFLTKKGKTMSRALRYIDSRQLKDILS